MCFSAMASFATGAALIPAGAYCLRRAAVVDPDALALSAAPVIFGVQQILEGFVWMGLDQGNTALARGATVGFLFFAIVFWPFWIPWSAFRLEKHRRRQNTFRLAALLGLGGALFIYLPLVEDGGRGVHASVLHHSIRYEFALRPLLRGVPLGIWQAVYVLFATVFWYAFISVWCAFAAVLAGWLCWTLAVRERTPALGAVLFGPARDLP